MEQDSPSPPRGLRLETVQPVAVKKLNSETVDSVSSLQLTVRLVPQDERTIGEWGADTWRKLWRDRTARVLIIVGLVALLGVGLQWLLFLYPPKERDDPVGQVVCSAQYPKWIAPRDEEPLSMTLFNNGNTDLTQVKVLLVFTDTLCLRTAEEGSTVVDFGDLTAGERKTRTVRFTLDRMAHRCPRAKIQSHLISAEQGIDGIPSPYAMQVLPTPYYKTFVQKAWGFLLSVISAILGALAKKLPDISGS